MKLAVLGKPKIRQHELTAVLNRDIFERLPAGVTSQRDRDRWGLFRSQYNLAQQLHSFPFPLQLDFELNSTCNMKCGFCLHGNERVAKKELSVNSFEAAIAEGEKHGLCSVKFNYINEPLLRNGFPSFVAHARKHGILNTYFATNGSLLNRDAIESLIEVQLSKIMVSLDATTPETFLKMRKSKQFELVVANIHELLSLRKKHGVNHPLVRVNFLKTRDNEHEAEDFIQTWEGVADSIGFQEYVAIPGIENGDNVLPKDLGDFRCSFPFKLMVVDANGDILPCCTFSGRSMAMGNISTTTIKKAWESMKMAQLRLLHREGDYRDNPTCNHCMNGK